MAIQRRNFLRMAAGAALMPAWMPMASAQSYPTRPITLVAPVPTGGAMDVVARLFGPFLSKELGQPVVIENRPGGGTAVGANAVLQAEPDGYTLLLSNSPTHLIAPLITKGFPSEPLKDFKPIATIGAASNVIVIAPDLPAKNVKEFVAHAKENPGKLNFGFGQGTQPQLVGEMFKMAADIDITNVPYKGSGQAVTDMLGGRIHLAIGLPATLWKLHSAGKVRMIGYTGTERNKSMPDIPTMVESGYPSVVSTTYFGILGRSELSGEIVKRLNEATGKALKSEEFQKGLTNILFRPVTTTPEEIADLFAKEQERWIKVVKATGFGS